MDIQKSIVSILDKKKKIIGTGFVAGENLILTCAHVVEKITSHVIDPTTTGLSIQVTVRFAVDGSEAVAQLDAQSCSPSYERDVALLHVDTLPQGAELWPLAPAVGSAGHDFSTYGYATVTEVQGISASGKIVGIVDSGRLVQLTSQELDHGMSGAPVLDKQRQVVVGMVTKGKSVGDEKSQRNIYTTFATSTDVIFEVCRELKPTEICPYRSLDAFTEDDERFFFGRERVVTKLLENLRRKPRFLAVLGPSGCGKSSVVRAGLIPALKAGKVPGSQKWGVVIIRPTTNQPLEQIVALELLQFGAEGLQGAVNAWLASHPEKERLVLVIDQFEEALVSGKDEIHQAFFRGLADLLESTVELSLIITLRDDFYSRFLEYATPLIPWLEEGLINIPSTLKRDELSAMMLEPARLLGLIFDEGLPDVILNNTAETGGLARSTILPLLQFSLTQLWESRQEGRLTFATYNNIGGVAGGLAQWADRAYYELSPEYKPKARSILIRLVRLGNQSEGIAATRRRLPLEELGEDLAIPEILRHFVERRLMSSTLEGGHDMVEYIHDALVREWQLLGQWLHEDHAFLTWRQTLREALHTWHSHQQDDGDLFRGVSLVETEAWLFTHRDELLANEREFLRASLALRDWETQRDEQARQTEQYARQKKAEETEEQRRSSDPQEREASGRMRALAQQQIDFERHGSLLSADELDILIVERKNPKLVLEEAYYRMILYSAVACDTGQKWLVPLGEQSLQLLRQACLDEACASQIRMGAAACLGDINDQSTFEDLSQAFQRAEKGPRKLFLLDLLAHYLVHADQTRPVPQKVGWAVFPRLARLRISQGQPERVRMSRIALKLALVAMSIYFPATVLDTGIGPDKIAIVVTLLIFAIFGLAMSYAFAEGITSISLVTQTWARAWRAVILAAFGGGIGIMMFFGHADLWFVGSLIGLVIAFSPQHPKKMPNRLRVGLSVTLSVLVILFGFVIMPTPVDGSLLSKTCIALAAGCFSGLYIYFAANPLPSTGSKSS